MTKHQLLQIQRHLEAAQDHYYAVCTFNSDPAKRDAAEEALRDVSDLLARLHLLPTGGTDMRKVFDNSANTHRFPR